jgi:hypothetical protein
MGRAPKLADSKRVLVVEGHSDLVFYAELLEHLGFASGDVYIQGCNGRSDLDAQLQVLINPGFLAEKTHIGVIVDADDSAQGAAKRFTSLLRDLTKQRDVSVAGWTAASPRVGLWIAPDGEQPGEIETLVWNAWSPDPRNAQPKSCIESFVACMAKSGLSPKSPSKGLLSCLLAICNDEDPRLGPGARCKVFDFLRPELAPLLGFLRGLGS